MAEIKTVNPRDGVGHAEFLGRYRAQARRCGKWLAVFLVAVAIGVYFLFS